MKRRKGERVQSGSYDVQRPLESILAGQVFRVPRGEGGKGGLCTLCALQRSILGMSSTLSFFIFFFISFEAKLLEKNTTGE